MVIENIQTERLPIDKMNRGPGGHWYSYRAWIVGLCVVGFCQTEREAILDLKKQINVSEW